MTDDALTLPAPAKLNLFLHVTGRRADGYHTLESLFVPIGLADRITVTCRGDGAVVRTPDIAEIPPEADLTVRAARLLAARTAGRLGVSIHLEKRIPAGGGLGGGSSDAATVLLGLNHLWNLRLSRVELQVLALELGADVPFFLGGGPALARGIGERLVPCTVPPTWVALVIPPVHVPTASIFAAPELTRTTPSAKLDVFSEGYGRNDLEAVAVTRFPAVGAALARLKAHSPDARMTGSGGCVFALFHTLEQAHGALADSIAAASGCRGLVCRTLARHPLAGFV